MRPQLGKGERCGLCGGKDLPDSSVLLAFLLGVDIGSVGGVRVVRHFVRSYKPLVNGGGGLRGRALVGAEILLLLLLHWLPLLPLLISLCRR